MTKLLSFKLENKRHTCYFVMAIWLSNFSWFQCPSRHLQFKSGASEKR